MSIHCPQCSSNTARREAGSTGTRGVLVSDAMMPLSPDSDDAMMRKVVVIPVDPIGGGVGAAHNRQESVCGSSLLSSSCEEKEKEQQVSPKQQVVSAESGCEETRGKTVSCVDCGVERHVDMFWRCACCTSLLCDTCMDDNRLPDELPEDTLCYECSLK